MCSVNIILDNLNKSDTCSDEYSDDDEWSLDSYDSLKNLEVTQQFDEK